MSKRGENIHKRKDGRWEGRYKKGRDANGAIIYGSVYGKTYREAKNKLMNKAAQQEFPHIGSDKPILFEDVLLMWLQNNQLRLKRTTLDRYQYLIERHILPELGKVNLSQITAIMINSFLAKKIQNGRLDRSGGLAPSYVRNIMIIIKAALRFAEGEQLCLPLKSPIYKPSKLQKELPILSYEEQRNLENHLLSQLTPTNLGILLSLHTGLRIGEICALSWNDVDLKTSVLHVRHTVSRIRNPEDKSSPRTKLVLNTPKTPTSFRDIPVSSNLFPILKKKKNENPDGYVISGIRDFLSPRTFDYRYHQVLKQCEIGPFNFHALRHTFATRCIEMGVDVKSLSEILGHANVSITLNTYVHSSMEMKKQQLEKLSLPSLLESE